MIRYMICCCAALVATLLPLRGVAGVVITGVSVEGREVPIRQVQDSSGNGLNPLVLSESVRSMAFSFADENGATRPALRLRYKLEGYDKSWQDLPGKIRLYVMFLDGDREIVGSEEILLAGESPGWTGVVEQSRFLTRRDRITVPARAANLRLAVISAPAEAIVGVIAVDFVRVFVERPGAGDVQLADFTIRDGTGLSDPLGTPSQWMRHGSRAELSQLRTRADPSPHTIIVIDDDDSARFGNWSTRSDIGVPVKPGEVVKVEWQTAYSIGAGGPGTAAYESLKPGSYLFRVQAARSNGASTGAECSLPVVVVPLFYRRMEFWLALLAAAVAVSAIVGRVVAGRRMQRHIQTIEREQALERERARIARDLHDEVGAGLTAIAMQSDWVRREISATAEPATRKRMDSVCQSAGELVRVVDEIVWAVNPSNDNVERFVNYLTQYTEQFLDSAGVRVRFDVPVGLPAIPLVGRVRHNVFLAVVESLNNIVKHAGADLVKLGVKVEGGRMTIVVEDNGRGFNVNSGAGDGVHDGIENMRRRLVDVKGRCDVCSQAGSGTKVLFEVAVGVD